ncbi:SRPBCC family protein [Prauserella cavernicola]|uniref:SRPBCC family protein n=1 Tax=Prauserella cavernicola TaxID=2800127 RepID=A0A934QR79_9PSEU|nr:SRPBCC family protein [Prauserella cavernicola]MBK1784638.1 SRPBCC family protein [Prauserella cavernicola]
MDIEVHRVIALPLRRVAAYAMDWRNDAVWTRGITRAELTVEAPGGGFGVGAEVRRSASFLGRRIDYVLRVLTHDPPDLLDMSSVAGPFAMRVTYRFAERPAGTLASIRVRSDASRFSGLTGALLTPLVRRAVAGDLRELEAKAR